MRRPLRGLVWSKGSTRPPPLFFHVHHSISAGTIKRKSRAPWRKGRRNSIADYWLETSARELGDEGAAVV